MARKVSIVMDQALNYRSKYEINVSTAVLKPKHKAGYSKTKLVYKKIVNTLLVLTIMLMVTVSSSGTPANAALEDIPGVGDVVENAKGAIDNAKKDAANAVKEALCYNEFEVPFSASPSEPGALSTGIDRSREDNGKKRTGLQQWGPEGPTVVGIFGARSIDSAPQPVKDAGYKEDNATFTDDCYPVEQTASTIAVNGLFSVSKFITWGTNTVISFSIGDERLQEDLKVMVVDTLEILRDTLYLDFLPVGTMIGGLILGYFGLYKRQATVALTQGIGMVVSSIAVMAFLAWPAQSVDFIIKINQDTGGSVITSMVAVDGKDGSNDNLCTVDGIGKQQTVDILQCNNWRNSSYYPFVKAQYGSLENANAVADRLPAVSLGSEEVSNNNAAIWQMEQQTIQKGASQEKKDAKKDEIVRLTNMFVGDPSDGRGGSVSEYFTGEKFGSRVGPGYEAVFSATITAIIVIPVALMYLVFSLWLILLCALIPFAGIITSAWPRFGIKFLTLFVNTYIKNVANLVYLGISLNIINRILTMTDGADPMTLVKLAIFGLLLYVGRRQIVSAVTGNFTDSATSFIESSAGTVGNKASSVVAGAAMGATGAMTGRFTSKLGAAGNKAMSAKAVARPKAAEFMGNTTRDETTSFKTPQNRPKTATAARMPAARNDPFTSETVGTPGTTFVAGTSRTSRANPDFRKGDQKVSTREQVKPSGATPVQAPSFEPTSKKAVSTSVRVEGPSAGYPKAKAEKVNIVATVAAGTVRGGVAGARAGSVAGGAQAGFNAGMQGATRNEVRAAQDTEVADAQREKERKDALRAMKSGSLPKASPASKPNDPRATGLPKRSEGGLPGSSKGGSPRATR